MTAHGRTEANCGRFGRCSQRAPSKRDVRVFSRSRPRRFALFRRGEFIFAPKSEIASQCLFMYAMALPRRLLGSVLRLSDRFEHMADLVGERALDVDELVSRVSIAPGEHGHELVGEVAR